MLTIFRRIHNKRYTTSFLLLITTMLLFSGCATQKYTPRHTTQTSTNKLSLEQKLRKYNLDKFMLLKDNFWHFKKGDMIQIKYVTSSLVKTDKGYIIPISKLIKIKKTSTIMRQQNKPHKTKFSLIVNAPKGARVRIMNIKQSTKMEFYLREGNIILKLLNQDLKHMIIG